MQFEELHTQRLILRKFTPEVYNSIFTTMDDAQIMAVHGLDTLESLEKEKSKYRQGLATYNRSFVNFKIIEKETNAIIGGCGFHTWYPEHFRAEIGYSLYDDKYKRKGLMTEAVTATLQYGFNEMNLYRVEALTATYNTASLKILENFNFKFEGTLREHYNVDGKLEDSVMYSLLKHEFQF